MRWTVKDYRDYARLIGAKREPKASYFPDCYVYPSKEEWIVCGPVGNGHGLAWGVGWDGEAMIRAWNRLGYGVVTVSWAKEGNVQVSTVGRTIYGEGETLTDAARNAALAWTRKECGR